MWVEHLQLTNFRNYAQLSLRLEPAPVVLYGANGSGKTNLLEAVSLLTSGQGLRRASYPDLAGTGGPAWSVWSRVQSKSGPVEIGTGLEADAGTSARAGRTVRIDGEPRSTSDLDEFVEIIWLTPAMDGLFTGPASDRRQFLDRLVTSFDPGYGVQRRRFERAMQQRNKLLAEDVRDAAQFEYFEQTMAETGVAMAASRSAAVAELRGAIDARRERAVGAAFPWAELAVSGSLEFALATRPAVDVEDDYCRLLARERERDRAAGRALDGPHRSDLIVGHGDKEMPAKICSTGEQKALLIGLILAHADLVGRRQDGMPPMLLLDEITAHLDTGRRLALFDEITALGCQAWLTGTEATAFSGLAGRARFYLVEDGHAMPAR
jgi:DNA replication and repair protein RecF